jgi:hypothetical protein
MEPPMDADHRRSELLQRQQRSVKLIRMHWVTTPMNRVESRVGVHRRASAVSSLFSDWG